MLREAGPGRYRIEAPLTFATVTALRPLGLAALAAASGRPAVIELGAVTQADSAGLALLVDWLAAARAANTPLRFEGLSPALRALARLSEVEDLLAPGASGAPEGS
jgi:phospholipid transport system transporter-binding protein